MIFTIEPFVLYILIVITDSSNTPHSRMKICCSQLPNAYTELRKEPKPTWVKSTPALITSESLT